MLPAYDSTEGSTLGRMSVDKQYHGDLEGTAKGEMLTGMTSVKDSGVYVAVVPDSGTDQLTGLSGTLNIIIKDGKHFYEFDYALATP